MQSRRTALGALAAFLITAVAMATACKPDAPTGRIKPETVEIKVGETAHVELLLASKYEGVSREMWKVEPASLGEVYYNQAEVKRRKASFRADEAGKGKLVVHGFFGDTKKPYRIAEVPVVVVE